jgi:hypothetical protein
MFKIELLQGGWERATGRGGVGPEVLAAIKYL